MRITTRPATAADVQRIHPGLTCSYRAWAVDLDGEPKGVIGIALLSPVACLFSAFEPELRPHLKRPAIGRLIKKAEAAVKASAVPVLAIAQEDEPTAPHILKRLGLRHLGAHLGDTIYGFVPGE